MQKIPTHLEEQVAPLFDLFESAAEVSIRETPAPNTTDISKEILFGNGKTRTFLLEVREKDETQKPEQPNVTPQARDYLLKSAELLIQDRDYLLARNIYSYLLKNNIRDVDAMMGLGTSFYSLHEIPSAKKCFRASYELGKRSLSLMWLGICLVAEGDDKAALEQFQLISNATDLSENEKFTLFKEMGNCSTRIEQFNDAWTYYHKALELQPGSDTIYVNIGMLEFNRNQLDVAGIYFEKALTLNPKSGRAKSGMGLIAIYRNDAETAKTLFRASLDLTPLNSAALIQLSSLARGNDELEDCRRRAVHYLEMDPHDGTVRSALASILKLQGKLTECIAQVDQVLAKDPNNTTARQLREQLLKHKTH